MRIGTGAGANGIEEYTRLFFWGRKPKSVPVAKNHVKVCMPLAFPATRGGEGCARGHLKRGTPQGPGAGVYKPGGRGGRPGKRGAQSGARATGASMTWLRNAKIFCFSNVGGRGRRGARCQPQWEEGLPAVMGPVACGLLLPACVLSFFCCRVRVRRGERAAPTGRGMDPTSSQGAAPAAKRGAARRGRLTGWRAGAPSALRGSPRRMRRRSCARPRRRGWRAPGCGWQRGRRARASGAVQSGPATGALKRDGDARLPSAPHAGASAAAGGGALRPRAG
jgi:hypothetical protein